MGALCGSNNISWDCVFIVSGDIAILGMCVYLTGDRAIKGI